MSNNQFQFRHNPSLLLQCETDHECIARYLFWHTFGHSNDDLSYTPIFVSEGVSDHTQHFLEYVLKSSPEFFVALRNAYKAMLKRTLLKTDAYFHNKCFWTPERVDEVRSWLKINWSDV